ncbi:peptidoglycan DD-metalloendopeptidase family protein [Microbacterium maritypicum]
MNQSNRRSRPSARASARAFAAIVAALAVVGGALVPTSSAEAAVSFVNPVNGRVADVVGGCPAGSRPTHQGVDVNQNANAVIYAAAGGTVTTAVNSNATTGYGSQIVIAHAEGYTTRYAHMVFGTVTIPVGTVVPQGTALGLVGSTGQSTGPHLHFEIYRGSVNVTNSYFACGQGNATALTPLNPRSYPVNADINGDNLSDLLAVSTAGQMFLYTGNGRGGWGTVPFGTGWQTTRSLIRGDFDGDGRGDILAIRTDGSLWFYRNRGGYVFDAKQVGWGWGALRLVSGGADYNGDRRADIIAVGTDNKLYLYAGNGAGGFDSALQISQGWGGIDFILAGDFAIDGRGDLLARDTAGRLFLFPGNGAGIDPATAQVGNGWNAMSAITGGSDYSSDGNADVIARDAVGDLWLYPWLGSSFGNRLKVGNGWFVHRLIH